MKNGVNMSTIDSHTMAKTPPPPRADTVNQKPLQSTDTVVKKIREVSMHTEQINADIAEKRSASGEQMSRVKARLEEAIRTLNASVDRNPNKLQFSVDSVSNKIMVVVTDEVTGETVRQVPAEALLRIAHNIEAMKGILFDKVL
jgi:flagellar protein FlaG